MKKDTDSMSLYPGVILVGPAGFEPTTKGL